jgi:tetratricopeptide (TPR) repeat protein
MHHRLACGVALACVLAWAGPALTQDWKGSGRLEGKVVDADGKPVADANVKLDLAGRGGTSLKTDKKGHWAILGLASGSWTVDVEAQGYTTKRTTVQVQQETRLAPIETKLDQSGPPAEVLAAVKKGDEAYAAGHWAEARAEYEKLLTLRPDLSRHLHLQIARCYSQEKNYEKELEHLQAILDANPGDQEVRMLAALEALRQRELFDRGVELLKGIDESTLQDPDVLYNIAVAFFNNQRPEDAARYLTRALSVKPDYADGYFLRANAYLNLNKIPEAKADYSRFVELAPSDPRVEAVKKVLAQLK